MAPATAAAPAPKLPANVVARVNNRDITREQMMSTFAQLGGQPLLRFMITDALVEQEAKRLGVSVSEAEINQRIKENKDQIAQQAMRMGQPMSFSEIARRDGISEGLLRYETRRELLARKAYRKFLQANLPSLNGQISASHILVATMPLPSPDGTTTKPLSEDEAKKKIEDLRAQIVAGKITFADAAKQNSDDKGSGAQGGELGFFGKGMNVKEFEEAAYALQKPGDLSGPVKSQYGYHLIRLDKTAPTAADTAKVHNQILAQRENDPNGIRMWMAGLAQQATVVTNTAAMAGAAVPLSRPRAPRRPKRRRAAAPALGCARSASANERPACSSTTINNARRRPPAGIVVTALARRQASKAAPSARGIDIPRCKGDRPPNGGQAPGLLLPSGRTAAFSSEGFQSLVRLGAARAPEGICAALPVL
jgi:parvulin-like peptidyl-prolyl isomerase